MVCDTRNVRMWDGRGKGSTDRSPVPGLGPCPCPCCLGNMWGSPLPSVHDLREDRNGHDTMSRAARRRPQDRVGEGRRWDPRRTWRAFLGASRPRPRCCEGPSPVQSPPVKFENFARPRWLPSQAGTGTHGAERGPGQRQQAPDARPGPPTGSRLILGTRLEQRY